MCLTTRIMRTPYFLNVSLHATAEAWIPLGEIAFLAVFALVTRTLTLVTCPLLTVFVEVSNKTTQNTNLHLLKDKHGYYVKCSIKYQVSS